MNLHNWNKVAQDRERWKKVDEQARTSNRLQRFIRRRYEIRILLFSPIICCCYLRLPTQSLCPKIPKSCVNTNYTNRTISYPVTALNPLTPNDPYSGRTALLTSKSCILYIYSTNICTEYFKHGLYSPFFPLQMQFVS